MSNAWRNLIISSLICHLVGFGIVLLNSVFAFSSLDVIGEFYWAWVFGRTWEVYLGLLPVSQAWAVMIVFALIVPMGATSSGGTSFERFGSSIIVLLVFAMIFAIVYLVGFPNAVRRVDEIEFTSMMAQSRRDAADLAIQEQDYTRAVAELEQYAALAGSNGALEEELRELREQVRADSARAEAERADAENAAVITASASELLDRAVASQNARDFSTAHYLATLARALEPENDEAARLAAEALSRLQTVGPSSEEEEEAALFARKQSAKAALTRLDYVSAYYEFASIIEDYPFDVDAQRYFVTAQESVASQTVFYDEVSAAMALPGLSDLAFVNRATAEVVELISIGKIVQTQDGIYVEDVEVFAITPEGRVLTQIVAEFGQLLDGRLILNVISRGSDRNDRRPQYLAGQVDAITEGIIQLTPNANELFLLASVSQDPASASTTALSQTTSTLERFGLLSEPVELEFLQRVATPFMFVVFSIFALGFSWRYRSRYLSLPPIATLVLIPIAPLAIAPAYLGFVHAQRLLLATLLLPLGFGSTLIVLIVLEALLLLLTLTYVALGSRD